VDVESAPEAGAAFRVYLPRATGDLAPAVAPRRPSAARGTETILLVEDETSVRRLVAEMLVRLGYTVVDAADAPAAYRAMEQRSGNVDLLLTDVVMPHTGGPEIARRLQSLYPDLKVLFMSGYAANILPETGAGYLPKPFSPQALAAKVREVLDGAPAWKRKPSARAPDPCPE
jgi:two-component system cell cycle sensor histidine kinase/response regulator CckA